MEQLGRASFSHKAQEASQSVLQYFEKPTMLETNNPVY